MSAGILRAYAPLFHQLIAEPRPRRMLIRMICIIVPGTAGVMWFGHAVVRLQGFGAFICCMAVAALMFVWCALFAASAVRQNHPANACLVPHLRRRLINCCVMLFVVSSVSVAGAIGGFFGHFGYALVAAGMMFPCLLFVQRFVSLVFMPTVLVLFSVSIQGPWLDWMIAWLLSLPEPLVVVVGLSLDVALLVLALRVAFPRGGERHWAWHHRLQKTRVAATKDAATRQVEGMWGWRLGFSSRDSVSSAPVGRQMMHVLGPSVSEGAHLISVVGFSLVTVAMLLAGLDFMVGRMIMVTSILRMSILFSVHSYVSSLLLAMAARSDEQGLYRLAPAAPVGRDFNRVFARSALLRFLKVWLVTLACLFCIDFAATGKPVPSGSTLVLAALVLLFARAPLRDYARWRPNPGNWRTIVGTLAGMASVLIITAVTDKYAGFPWWALAAAIAAVALIAVRQRWWEMMRTAPAFPAGRMGD